MKDFQLDTVAKCWLYFPMAIGTVMGYIGNPQDTIDRAEQIGGVDYIG